MGRFGSPTVFAQTKAGIIGYDMDSIMLSDRIIFVDDEITPELASDVIKQILYLEKQDPNTPITLYINSPGGYVTAGLAIYDTMQFVQCPISTVCMGMAASMASVLLSAGTKGKRYILPNAEVMIHQPSGGSIGQATEIKIACDNILKTRETLNRILSKHTGQSIDKVSIDVERDYYLSAEEAVKYGLVDEIIEKR